MTPGNPAYKALFEASLDAIICSDESGLITLWNPAAAHMFGYSSDEAVGQPLTMLMSAADQQRHNSAFRRVISSGQVRASGKSIEVQAQNRDGHPFPIELSLSSGKTEQGWCFTAILRDITNRKQMEQCRIANQQQLQSILDNSTTVIYLKDLNGQYSLINRRFEQLFHISKDDILGKTDYDVFPADKADQFRANDLKVLAAKTAMEFEESAPHDDGEHSYLSVKFPFTHPNGEVYGVCGISTDITDRKQSERAFDALVSSIVDHVGQSFFDQAVIQLAKWLQVDCVILGKISHTDRIRTLAMVQDGELIRGTSYKLSGSPCASLGNQGFCIYPEAVCSLFPDDRELREIGAQSYVGVPLCDIEGKSIGVLCAIGRNRLSPPEKIREVFKIIAARSAVELQRMQMETELSKLSHAITSAGEAIIITDQQGVIEYVNPAFTTLTGYSAEEAVGQNPRILKSGNQDADFYAAMWKTITSGKVWHGKVIDRKKDGSFYPAILTIAPVFNDDDGKVNGYTHFIGLQSDLSELEALEKQFHQAQKMEAIGTLVGGIAHDFNNMLAGITGNIYLSKQLTRETPDVFNKLTNIEKIAFRASDMIQQLLTFARKDQVSIKPIPFTSFIKETYKLLRPSVPENIAMHVHVCSDALQVKGDATLLHQVLMNLINNARDALEGIAEPCMTVRLERFHADDAFVESRTGLKSGDFAHLSVQDNGCGIPTHQIEHLFEPFFTTKEQGKGTGLGLAMVFGAVKTHDGFVEVDSTEGKGTTFHIYIPRLESEDLIAASEHAGKMEATGHGEMILLVDDDACIVETEQQVLEALGYRVMVARDGQQAVDTFTAHHESIALVILDVVMPVISGGKAAQLMRQVSPHVKIIFATGYDKNTQTELAGETVLGKPFSIVEMSHLIQQQLHG